MWSLFDLREHILAQVKGAGSLPIIDEAYDVVVCSNGFAPGQIYPDAIEEMLRLELEGGGGGAAILGRHCVGVMSWLDLILVVQVLCIRVKLRPMLGQVMLIRVELMLVPLVGEYLEL
jgi:hypothetical protein